jgi:hypothetical protein
MPDPVTGFTVGGSIIGGGMAAKGASDAANTNAAAADRAGILSKQMFDKQQEVNAPYVAGGTTAQNRLLELLGLGPNSGNADYGKYSRDFGTSDFVTDPGYNFRLLEGQKAIERSAAARGGTQSGAALKAAERFGQDVASQEYDRAYNRYNTNRSNQLAPLGSLIQSGQSAASGVSAAAGNYGTAGGNAIMAGGAANAAGQLGVGNTINNALNTGATAYQNQTNFNNYLASKNAQRGLYGGSTLTSNPTYSQDMYGYMRDQ